MKKVAFISILLIAFMTSIINVFANDSISQQINVSLNQQASTSFNLMNTDSKSHQYSLDFKSINNQYESYFDSNKQIVKQIDLNQNESLNLNLNLTMINQIQNYDHAKIIVTRDDGQVIEYPITINVQEDYVMSVSSNLSQIDATSGSGFDVSISIFNQGSQTLNNIQVVADLPSKWTSTQTSNVLYSLSPNESSILSMHINIDNAQSSGLVNINLQAISDQISSEQTSLDVNVKTNLNLSVWMFGLLAVISTFVLIQFRRFGRR